MKQVVRAVALAAGLLLARGSRGDEAGPSAGQRLAVQTKPAVVRVVAGYLVDVDLGQGRSDRRFVGGHGSGFFVAPDGYLVTNAHVVEFIQQGDEKAHAEIVENFLTQLARESKVDLASLPAGRLQELTRMAGQALRLVKKVSLVILPNGDQLVYDIKVFGIPVSQAGSKDVAILKVQIRNAPTLLLGDESSVELQDPIYAIGYPGAADDLVGVLDEKAMLEASITDGRVSALKKTADGVPVIQVTTTINPGNSGGPALNQKGEVIGLATFKAAQAEGYNFLVPASTVKEFIKQAGIQNQDSMTNQAFRTGLELHWAHHYTDAIKAFEEVRQLFPAHSEVARLITEAQELKRQGKEESGAGVAVIALAVGLVVAILAVAILVLVRRAKGPRPGRMIAAAGPGQFAPGPMMAVPGGPGHGMGMRGPPHGPAPVPQLAAQRGSGPAAAFQKTLAVSPAAGAAALAGLVCVRGHLRGQHFQFGPHGIVIGREAGAAQVVIPDGRVSSKHVWIGFEDGKLMAIDQGSTNGTFVNDMGRGRITRVELRHGDAVIVSEPDVMTVTVLLEKSAGLAGVR